MNKFLAMIGFVAILLLLVFIFLFFQTGMQFEIIIFIAICASCLSFKKWPAEKKIFILTCCCLLLSAYHSIPLYTIVRDGLHIQGTVIRKDSMYILSRFNPVKSCIPVIYFKAPDNKYYEFADHLKCLTSLNIQDKVDVIYDPNNPQLAIVNHGYGWDWIKVGLWLGIALFFAIILLTVKLHKKKKSLKLCSKL